MSDTDSARVEPLDTSATIVSLFAAQCKCAPDAIAVRTAGSDSASDVTYQQLSERTDQVAEYLRRQLKGNPARPVGICFDRSLQTIIAIVGILKAGAACLPLDPEYPAQRLSLMLENVLPPLILLPDSIVPESLRKIPAETTLVRVASVLAETRADSVTDNVRPEDLFYIIHTSGSTGVPKAVALPHRALTNLILWQRATSPAPTVRTLQFSSLSFDVSYQEIFSTLCGGGTLVLAPESVRMDPSALLNVLESERIERLFLPFVALQRLAEAFAASSRKSLPVLREVITAGEQLKTTPAIQHFFRTNPFCALRNQYGPSETHVTTEYVLSGDLEQWPALPPIGQSLPGHEAWIVGATGTPLPDGEEGELYLGGIGLADGYYNQPTLTSERFVPHFRDPKERLYRTGDLCRRRPEDGEIEFRGRLDDQVKIRGFRVELGEVEQALLSYPPLQTAVVTAYEWQPGDTRLVAYLVMRNPADTFDITAARQFLHERLPEYLVPNRFILMPGGLPLTNTGKVNRRALPVPGMTIERPNLTNAVFVRPATPTEIQIAAAWEEVLGIRGIGVDDGFEDLGGTSLQLTAIHQKLAAKWGDSVDVTLFFEHGTIRSLAQTLDRLSKRPDTGSSLASDAMRRAQQQREAMARLRPRPGR